MKKSWLRMLSKLCALVGIMLLLITIVFSAGFKMAERTIESCDEDYCLEKGWVTECDNVPACDSCCMPLLSNVTGFGFQEASFSVRDIIEGVKLQKAQCNTNEVVTAETVMINGVVNVEFRCRALQQNSTSQVIERVIDTCPQKKCYCTLGGTGQLVTPNLSVSGVQ